MANRSKKYWLDFKGNTGTNALKIKAAASEFCVSHIIAKYAHVDEFQNIFTIGCINYFSDKVMARKNRQCCQRDEVQNESTMKIDVLNTLFFIRIEPIRIFRLKFVLK